MQKLTILLRFIGVVQIILGLAVLLVPAPMFAWMGLEIPPTDNNYMLGMLGARFIAYGIGMFIIARAPEKNLFWINNMILIQVVDLAVGIFYTATGTLTLSVSAFPMFNASVFIILLLLWRPRKTAEAAETA